MSCVTGIVHLILGLSTSSGVASLSARCNFLSIDYKVMVTEETLTKMVPQDVSRLKLLKPGPEAPTGTPLTRPRGWPGSRTLAHADKV